MCESPPADGPLQEHQQQTQVPLHQPPPLQLPQQRSSNNSSRGGGRWGGEKNTSSSTSPAPDWDPMCGEVRAAFCFCSLAKLQSWGVSP
eukprot:scaffold87353_cov17-Tisochrysis_lutea.AAC.1